MIKIDKLIEKSEDELTQYDKKVLESKYIRFKQICEYDFKRVIVEKLVGDESRTFLITNQNKPLLSPSRISKIFNEHIFWNIPKKTLLLPRLLGQLIHKFIEIWITTEKKDKLTLDNFEEYAGKDWIIINEEWSKQKQLTFIDEVNEAVNNIYNYLNLKKIKIINCEKYVCNSNYHGYIDMVGFKWYKNSNGGERVPLLIDLKVTANEEIIDCYYAQLAIYREIFEKTTNCYILFYNRNTKTPRLEKASWSKLDEAYDAINKINKLYRGD